MSGTSAVAIGRSVQPVDLSHLIKYFRDNRDSLLKLQRISRLPDNRTDLTPVVEQCAREGFALRLVELSILDPDEPETTIALVLVPASSGEAIALAYRDQMRLNLNDEERRPADRGPIVPNPALYDSVAWRMALKESSLPAASPAAEEEPHALESWVTSYESGLHRADHRVQASIEAFGREVFVAATKAMPAFGEDVSELLVVPFPAPAQGRRARGTGALNGGAVFLWGRWTHAGPVNEQGILRLAERIAQTMTRTVLLYSRLASEELEHVRDVLLRTKHALFNPAVVAERLLNRVAESWDDDARRASAKPDLETARSTVGALRRFCDVIDLLYRRRSDPGRLKLKDGTAEWPDLVAAVTMLPHPDGTPLRVRTDVTGEARPVFGNADGWELVFWLLMKNAAEAGERSVSDGNQPLVTIHLSYDDADPTGRRTPRARLEISNPCGPIDEHRLREMEDAFMGRAPGISPDPSKPKGMGLGLATVGQVLSEIGVGARRRLWLEAQTLHIEVLAEVADA